MSDYTSAKELSSIDDSKLREENEKFHFAETRFEFIRRHKSLRPGNMHMLLGPTGNGKSSLVRSLISDFADAHRILVYSTEETATDFLTQCSYLPKKPNTANISWLHENQVMQELGEESGNINALIKKLDWAIAAQRSEILFLDNITASAYHQEIKIAGLVAQKLRELMVKLNMPFFVVAHTTAAVKANSMFEAADMRGNRMLAIKAEYLYCIAKFVETIDDKARMAHFLKIDKSRNHSGGDRVYRMWFNSAEKEYTSSEPYSYEEFQKFVSRRRA